MGRWFHIFPIGRIQDDGLGAYQERWHVIRSEKENLQHGQLALHHRRDPYSRLASRRFRIQRNRIDPPTARIGADLCAPADHPRKEREVVIGSEILL
jgi:hypothetical protein